MLPNYAGSVGGASKPLSAEIVYGLLEVNAVVAFGSKLGDEFQKETAGLSNFLPYTPAS